MSSKMIELGIDKMSVEERRELRDEIDKSLNGSAIPALTEQRRAELQYRLAEMDAHPERILTLEQVLANIEAKR